MVMRNEVEIGWRNNCIPVKRLFMLVNLSSIRSHQPTGPTVHIALYTQLMIPTAERHIEIWTNYFAKLHNKRIRSQEEDRNEPSITFYEEQSRR